MNPRERMPSAPRSGLKSKLLPPPRCPQFVIAVLLSASSIAQPAEELRGLWVDAFHPGIRNESEVHQLVTDSRRTGFNALFVEVRRRGDALYESAFEPRATEIEPGFDPLRQLLTEAHDTTAGARLEIHAWVVTLNIWGSHTTPPPQHDHPFLHHADWLTRNQHGSTWDGFNYAFDPGHPAVQEYTFNVIMDLVRHYDVDGLHLDYIRHPGREFGYNPTAVRRFNDRFQRSGTPAPTDPDWSQFRRDQVTSLVRRLYLTALEEKPALKISAATITFAPGVTHTSQWPSSSAYTDVLQDWRAWMEEGILDWNIPMAYFRQQDHATALADWNVFIKDHQYHRRAAIGLGWFLNTVPASLAQTRLARRTTPAGHDAIGFVGYSYSNPATNAPRAAMFSALAHPSRHERQPIPILTGPATVPAVPWKTSPLSGHLKGFVRDAITESGIDGATVNLEGPTRRTLLTDASGFFGTVDLPPGGYSVRVLARDHETSTSDVSLKGGTVAHLEYALTQPPPKPAPSDP